MYVFVSGHDVRALHIGVRHVIFHVQVSIDMPNVPMHTSWYARTLDFVASICIYSMRVFTVCFPCIKKSPVEAPLVSFFLLECAAPKTILCVRGTRSQINI
jgi:hypothetical protein